MTVTVASVHFVATAEGSFSSVLPAFAVLRWRERRLWGQFHGGRCVPVLAQQLLPRLRLLASIHRRRTICDALLRRLSCISMFGQRPFQQGKTYAPMLLKRGNLLLVLNGIFAAGAKCYELLGLN